MGRKKPILDQTSAIINNFDALGAVLTDLSPVSSVIDGVPADQIPNIAPDAITAPQPQLVSDPRFMYVTSHNLRRSVLTGDVKHGKIVLPIDMFRRLTAVGLNNGVTWDEVLRALVDSELNSIDPFNHAKRFLPQP